jgi:hypothetical protein
MALGGGAMLQGHRLRGTWQRDTLYIALNRYSAELFERQSAGSEAAPETELSTCRAAGSG